MDPRMLAFYESELAFVRDMGSEFAAEHPKIAGRLDLGSTEVADPYVERLLEGFAFLTARIQLKMAAEFPTFTQSLLQMVYPHYLAPTPSMAVVRFRPDPTGIRGAPQGVTLPAGTVLRSLLGTEDQTNCEFRTGHPVQLLPIELTEAEYISSPAAVAALGLPEQRGVKAAIRLRLKASGDLVFNKIGLERLSLFLGGPEGSRARLYEQLVANVAAIYTRPTTRPLPWQERLPPSAIVARGFDAADGLLPSAPQSFDGYRLLQEYYAMPERFLFIDIDGLDRSAVRCAGNELDIVVLLTRSEPTLAAGFGVDHLKLFCAPAINLFPRRSDRINLSERDAEHVIVPDRMRPLDFEVFSVQGVEGYAADGSAPQPFMPFYAANDLSRNPGLRSYYMLRRQPAPARPRPDVHQPRPAAVDAGGQAADRFHHYGERAGRVGALRGWPDRAAAVPHRRRLCLAVHFPSRAELSQPDRHRYDAGRGGAARIAAPLCSLDHLAGVPPARESAVGGIPSGGAAHAR
jgi:type VI secretion system protein ImpG